MSARRRPTCTERTRRGTAGSRAAARAPPQRPRPSATAQRLADGRRVRARAHPEPRERAATRVRRCVAGPVRVAETRKPSVARAQHQHGPLGADRDPQACSGRRGRSAATITSGSAGRRRDRARAPSTRSRLRPELRPRAPAAPRPATRGVPPTISSVSHREDRRLERARRRRRPRGRAARARPRANGPDGKQPAERRAPRARSGQCRGARRALCVRGSHPARFRRDVAFPYSGGSSSGAEEANLVLEHDAEPLVDAPPRLGHQRDRVRRGGAAGVLDEVRVPRRDHRAADPVPLEPALLDHPPGAELRRRVLEDAAERALVRRLRRLALREQLGDLRLDLVRRSGREPEANLRDDLAGRERRVPVARARARRR